MRCLNSITSSYSRMSVPPKPGRSSHAASPRDGRTRIPVRAPRTGASSSRTPCSSCSGCATRQKPRVHRCNEASSGRAGANGMPAPCHRSVCACARLAPAVASCPSMPGSTARRGCPLRTLFMWAQTSRSPNPGGSISDSRGNRMPPSCAEFNRASIRQGSRRSPIYGSAVPSPGRPPQSRGKWCEQDSLHSRARASIPCKSPWTVEHGGVSKICGQFSLCSSAGRVCHACVPLGRAAAQNGRTCSKTTCTVTCPRSRRILPSAEPTALRMKFFNRLPSGPV